MAPKPTSGLTTQSVSHFLINAGAIYINYDLPDERLLGATRDGVTFTIEQDIAEIDVDGSRGPFMGGRRIIEVRPRIESTFLEMTPENLKMAIVGSTSAPFEDPDTGEITHTEITRTRGIQMSDYIANVAIVGTLAGSSQNFVGIIYNALQDGELTFETADTGETGIGVTFTGHFDPSAGQNVEPWSIRIPTIDNNQAFPTP